MLTQERLKELLTYDPATGLFRWNVDRYRVRKGDIAGTHCKAHGYINLKLGQRLYKAHRLAFLYMEGAFPPALVDHINGNRADNRWSNLRHATNSQNGANTGIRSHNAIGVKGIRKRGKRLSASITIKGKTYHLGTFDTIKEASNAYQTAANDAFGEFARLERAQHVSHE